MVTTIERVGGSSTTAAPDDLATVRRELAERIRATEIRTDHGRSITLEPGRVVALDGQPGSGLTRVGLALLVEVARQAPVVAVDVRGWISPLAAWEVGIPPDRFVLVREAGDHWPTVMSTLIDGVRAVYAEIPVGTPPSVLRRLAAGARARRVGLVLRPVRGSVPTGIAHLTIEADDIRWSGVGPGLGHLGERSIRLRARGKAVAGIERSIEVEDDGTHPLHLVGGVAAARRATG